MQKNSTEDGEQAGGQSWTSVVRIDNPTGFPPTTTMCLDDFSGGDALAVTAVVGAFLVP